MQELHTERTIDPWTVIFICIYIIYTTDFFTKIVFVTNIENVFSVINFHSLILHMHKMSSQLLKYAQMIHFVQNAKSCKVCHRLKSKLITFGLNRLASGSGEKRVGRKIEVCRTSSCHFFLCYASPPSPPPSPHSTQWKAGTLLAGKSPGLTSSCIISIAKRCS